MARVTITGIIEPYYFLHITKSLPLKDYFDKVPAVARIVVKDSLAETQMAVMSIFKVVKTSALVFMAMYY